MNLELPDPVLAHPLREESAWIAHRDSGIRPLIESELTTTQQSRDEFLTGAWLLGLLDTVHPQMMRVVDMLNGGRLMNAVIMPRRSSKTTTLLCVLLGRCYVRPVHFAAFTLLTTQKKTSERYRLDVYGPISRKWPEEDTRPVKLIRSNGSERVEFANGSVLGVLSPDGDAVRSGAYDTMLLDESGECTPERWEDIIGAVVPSFDTRPEGQLILAGTAGDYRGGSEFWNTLNDERAGRVAFMVPDDTDPEALEAWEPDEAHPNARAGELAERMHPGIGTLTTLERIRNGFERLGPKRFAREYFNIFGAEGASTALIPAPLWTAAALPHGSLTPDDEPEVSALALFVHPDATAASLVEAWTGEGGRVHVALVHHQHGMQGLAKRVLLEARKRKRPLVFDGGSAATGVVMQEIRESRPAPSERPLLTRDVSRAAVRTMNLIREDRLRHYDQAELNSAAEIAVKRAFGQSGGWAFGRPDVRNRPDDDITPVEAMTLAVYALQDEKPVGKPTISFFD